MVESELVPLAEAVPEAAYGFAPSKGAFDKVRTFGQQVSHVAAVNYACAAAILGEKNPIEMGAGENGPAMMSKAEIVKFLKDSMAYSHKAVATITDANVYGNVQSPFGANQTTRLNMGNVLAWHSMDHYGQMVVYARMNNVVPPASRQ